ncbi:hypothetical protein F5887DRAFT_1175425 [Amanita rubescens]|nr:hypothetical protein F5887DRAFT_1289954 [Amanita rubescens]KAF8332154.1 hypothetical protein F5887DRAFT_1175425 [Amanita rubescens]
MSHEVFPPEILDEIIDHLDDESTLLSLGLVCSRALVKSRRRLFSSLQFTNHKTDNRKTFENHKTFDNFLLLAGAPWTSFTLAVEEIHLQDVFHHSFCYRNKWDPTRVASNLCNVKSLSISTHRTVSKLGWLKVVPCQVLEVIFQLNLHDLQLDAVGYWLKGEVEMFFSQLPSSIKTLAFRKLKFMEKPDLSHHLHIFPCSFQFRILDNISLALLGDVLDPSINQGVNVAVQAFHIHPYDADVPLTQRFLHHIGHCVEQLLISFDLYPLTAPPMHVNSFSTDGSPEYLDPVQLTQCTNVRIVYFVFIEHVAIDASQQPSLVLAMWKMLLALPSPNALEECWLKFTPLQDFMEDQLSCLGFFESPNLLHRLRHMFPNLKMINIIMVAWSVPSETYFELLRWQVKDLAAFEEIGLVKLTAIDGFKHVACHHSIVEGCEHL